MAKVSPQITDTNSALAVQLNPVVYLPKIACPYTTVVKRAQCTDFSNDLFPRFGIDRVETQAIQEVQGEQGPNGERVFKPINDQHDAVRFVGAWINSVGTQGPNIYSGVSGSYVEITFYGTGLNLLVFQDASNRDFSVSVDGGASSTIANTGSDIIQLRGYSANAVVGVASGLTLGVHTVKLTTLSATNRIWFGYEVLNTNNTLQQTAGTSYLGGKRLYQPSLTTSSPTGGFTTTYGTPGSKGSHVLVYQDSNGVVLKDARYTETSALYLASANHTNESVTRTTNWREFGAGRADDFSSLTPSAASDRAFTLDDGTTTLVGRSVVTATTETCAIATDNTGFLTFTFVGTGIDMTWVTGATGTNGAANAFEVFIDGVSRGNWDTTAVSGVYTKKKIASGLPYGTHTVKIQRNVVSVWSLCIKDFIVYAPTIPALPSGCVALADYYVMADYVITPTGQGSSLETSQGVLRKAQTRESVYSGTWAIAAVNPGQLNGFSINTSTTSNYVELTFVGTGINLRGSYTSTTPIVTVNVDGSAYTGAATANGGTWTGGSSQWNITGAFGGLLSISGLTFGLHTIRMTKTATGADFIYVGADIITPIHSPKGNLPGDLQNTLMVGSCAVGDQRQFSATAVKPLANWAQAVGVASGPSTNVTAFVPMPDMSLTLKTSGNPVQIAYSVMGRTNSSDGNSSSFQVFVNGVAVGGDRFYQTPASGYSAVVSDILIVPLSAGTNKIDLYWRSLGGPTVTATSSGITRIISAMEL